MANCFEELRGEKGFGQYGGPCHRKGSCFLPRSKAQGTGFHLHKLKGSPGTRDNTGVEKGRTRDMNSFIDDLSGVELCRPVTRLRKKEVLQVL